MSLFFRSNKRKIVSVLTMVFLSFPVFAYIIFSNRLVYTSKAEPDIPLLIIDAGHGGIDSGAVSADGSKESDLNLAIALKLRALAEFYGFENSLTRQDDNSLCDTPQYSEHRDLERRAEIVNDNNGCVYISIHQNCYPTGHPSGSLVIYSARESSEKLGKLTHSNLITCLNPENRRIAEPADDKYYILSHVSCPAILVECGFMSNFSEMEKLKTPGYQTSIAAVLAASFLQYVQADRYI